MNLTCQKCEAEFEAVRTIGYCPDCHQAYDELRQVRRERQEAAQAAVGACHISGKWGDPKDSPSTIFDPITEQQVCGMCGGEIESCYGFAGGFGLGAYWYCIECHTVQDFCEDNE